MGLAWVRETQPGASGGSGGGVAQMQVRNVADTLWVNVGPSNAHVPVDVPNVVHVDDNGGLLSVDDGAGSLTVDAPVATPVFARLSDGAAVLIGQKVMASSLPVTVASDQSSLPTTEARLPAALDAGGGLKVHEQGVVPVTDNGGLLSIDDGAGTITVDAPVGTPVATRLSDGAVFIDPRDVSDRAARLVGVVSGGANVFHIDDNAGSVTVDAPVATPAAVRISDGAAFIDPRDVSDRIARLVGQVDGRAATDAPVAGNPHQFGGRASSPAIPTAMSADGDAVPAWLDRSGAQIVRKRPIATYSAVYRLVDATAAARTSGFALTANVDKQWATIYHPNTATKRVQIKYIVLTILFISPGGQLEFEIQPLSATTAPATGNPAITPGKHDQADAAAEATCLLMPTTQGSVVAVNSPVGDAWMSNAGTSGAASVVNPPDVGRKIVLFDSRTSDDEKDLIMRPAVAEGYAVVGRSNAASNLNCLVTAIFTEE